LSFPVLPQLRPTPDRVRETLFNWLQPVIVGARCLDLFAGSGALGIEALSRGAGRVTFVDRNPRIGKHLLGALTRLGVPSGEREGCAAVVVAEALAFLDGPARAFDIVFLDPPYAADLLPAVCQRLAAPAWLARDALIYLECATAEPLPALPTGWVVHRAKRAGQVAYHLLRAVGP
jgi:16S rRNA (guanine966-N2)-methyltransferase